MPRIGLSDTEFVSWFERVGAAETARTFGLSERAVYSRRRRIEGTLGRELIAGGAHADALQKRGLPGKAAPKIEIQNGVVLVGSDQHYWDMVSTAHRAFLKLCRKLKPVCVVLDGDILDFPRISRHPPIGWEGRPTVLQELHHAKQRLEEISRAIPKDCKRYWPAGNHDLRFESRLASAAPEFEGVEGTHLRDHFPDWTPCWLLQINDDVVIKHVFKGGMHSTQNNTLWAGRTVVTGHDHALRVSPLSDYNGTRWGVNCGTMAEPYGPQFVDYTQANPVNWRSGFVVLTFRDGVLTWPEIVHVVREGVYDFRGEFHDV